MSCDIEYGKSKLSPCALGLAMGVLKGFCMLIVAWVAFFFGMGTEMVGHMASYYHGVSASFVGGLIGAVYGLVIGFIFGYLFGWLYNKFLCCCRGSSKDVE